tara:strand:+ start:6300 stop:7607 length:1308 start_codon:yes stop_codon:yes gene_type:complete
MKSSPSLKLRKILNDLKRRPEDAAKDLGISKDKIDKILSNEAKLDLNLIEKAVQVWPVNYSDFFHIEDDTKNGYKIFKSSQSNSSERIMYRGGKPYYLYKDTVMSKVSPFRPEWIQELAVVDNLDPSDDKVKFNNGHFLHQFTYFIGPVNFYYIENKEKKVAAMNTGDSMYISPYVPHTFTTRKNSKNELGHILALTYTDKIDGESVNELSAIGYDLAKKFKLNINNESESFVDNLNYQLNAASMTYENIKENINIDLNKFSKEKKPPDLITLKRISDYLNINIRDLLPPIKNHEVKIKKYEDNRSWFFPSTQNQIYKFLELTNLAQLPLSKAYELQILQEQEHSSNMEIPCHQYIYNVGEKNCSIKIEDKFTEKFEPGDSIYLKPYLKHKFYNKGKLLILRIGGKISGDVLYQLSMISEENIKRLIEDNKAWFD